MKFCAVVIFALFLSACGKESSGIPDVPVNYHITIQAFQAQNKDGILLVNNVGVAGLLIYKIANDQYIAFDRCSTVNPEKRCAVTPDDTGLTATDACSGAKFSLYDGAPVKAPAKKSLKMYSTSVTNFDIYVVN